MNLFKIKQAIKTLNAEELRELNIYVLDTSKRLGRELKKEFTVGKRIKCDNEIFIIKKSNRTKAVCLKEGTGELWNIPFSVMSLA